MADSKLSALTAATSVDYLYGISGGVSKKIAESLFGRVHLDHQLISSPVDYIDFALPSGYSSYELKIARLVFSNATGNGGLACAFSPDAGSTFYNAAASYSMPAGLASGTANTDKLIRFSFDDWASLGSLSNVSIAKGGSGHNAYVLASLTYAYRSGSTPATDHVSGWLTDTTDAMNLIRFVPYADGTIGPPTASIKISTASCHLWGIPD